MLALVPNENKSAIQFIFSDFFTEEKQYVTAFDLDQAKEIGKDLVKVVTEIQKKKK